MKGIVKISDGPLGSFGSARYRTIMPFSFQTEITGYFTHFDPVTLYQDGSMTISPGFEYDGPSGPTHDDSQNMVPALGHDALYFLGRKALLPKGWRRKADRLLYREMVNRIPKNAPLWKRIAMRVRSCAYYAGVRVFGGPYGSKRRSK